jgi:hypothetical protein
MSRLLQLQSVIRETVAGLAHFDQAIAADPESYSLSLAAKSLRDQYNQLQSQFLAEANRLEVDVCSYRLFAMLGGARYTLTEITTALQDFQSFFTTVYRALAMRMNKKRSEIENPDFGIAYTFPGSLGVVLTLPRELQMFSSGQEYDKAMETVFGMARARTAEEIVNHARSVGSGAVRRMDKWAADHLSYGFGADISWKSQTASPTRLFVQPPQIKNLRNAISLSDYSAPRDVDVIGMLWGADLDRKSFHFKTETKQDIRGRFSDAITLDHRAQLPAPYTAKLRITTQSLYATEQEEDDYFLLSLEPREHEQAKEQ